MHDLSASTRIAVRFDQIRTDSLQTSLCFVWFANDITHTWSWNRFRLQLQVSRDDNEQSTHLKTSSETFKKKIDQQAEHFNDFSQIHLRSEHRRSSSHLSRHRIISIHLLCLNLICSQRETQLQAKKECNVNLHEKYSNSRDLDHRRRFQNHRQSDLEH